MTHPKEIIKIINEDEKKNNQKQIQKKNNILSNISPNDKHLKIKISSELYKVPTPSNRLKHNIKINPKNSNNNIFPNSNFGLKKIKTLNINKDKTISNNEMKKNFSSKLDKYNYSIDKIYKNENRENINSIKKFKIVNNTDKKIVKSYPNEITESNNQIINSKKMSSNFKGNNIKNTFLGKPLLLNKFLSINSNEMRKSRISSQNLENYNIKKDNNKNQDLHIKVNNNNISNIKNKNKNKNFSTKNIQIKKGDDKKATIGRKCFISNQNIVKVDISKKPFNDYNDENCEQRKSMKKKKKNYHFDFCKELKLKKPIKRNIFQSLISMNKENIFNSDKKLIKIEKKKTKKNIPKKKDSSFDSIIRNILDSSSFSKSNKNEKEKKINSKENNNELNLDSSFLSNYKNNKDDKKKDILKFQQYKMKHINSICLGGYLKMSIDKKNKIVKVPAFSVVKPDKLISFEYNREYETRNRSYYMNNNENINDETNIKEKRGISQKTGSYNKIKKRTRIFCCL